MMIGTSAARSLPDGKSNDTTYKCMFLFLLVCATPVLIPAACFGGEQEKKKTVRSKNLQSSSQDIAYFEVYEIRVQACCQVKIRIDVPGEHMFALA